ncbi:MAG: hypothetical protein ABIG66_00180 [Candidatus Kerfeldbacteria bacterium]
MEKLRDRIDENKLKQLRDSSFPKPIHAINFVEFKNSRYYSIYGLLFAPFAIFKNVRPIWVGLHESTITGESYADEIVIAQYPSRNILIDMFTGSFYEKINGLREKGVKKLGFSICKKEFGNKIKKKKLLVLQFNHRHADTKAALDLFEKSAGKYCTVEYLAHEYGWLDIFKKTTDTDPVEVSAKNIALLSGDFGSINEWSPELRQDLEQNGFEIVSMQLFRTAGTWELMPWAKKH